MQGHRAHIIARRQFGLAVLATVIVDLGLYTYGLVQGYHLHAEYLVWNLFLAVLPLAFAMRLLHVLSYKHWSDWEPLGWTLAWWIFLPNSFYMISDFIHLAEMPAAHLLYAAVLFTGFINTAVLLGFGSLGLVHAQLRRRLNPRTASLLVALTLLSCSFAIYIGRDLRWNSWDVIFNTSGLLFDISDRLLRPEAYPQMFITVLSFFALLASLYALLWFAARLLRRYAHE